MAGCANTKSRTPLFRSFIRAKKVIELFAVCVSNCEKKDGAIIVRQVVGTLPHPHPLFRLVRPKILQRSTTHSVSSVPPADAVTGISQSNPTWQVAERRVAKFLNKEKSRDTMSATKKKSISKKMFTSPFRRRKAKEQPDATLSPETTEPVAAKALSAEEVDNTGPYSEEEGFCEPDSVWCGSTCAIS